MHSSGWVSIHPGGETAEADNARFRAILGHCPRCIAVLDSDGVLVGYNREFASLFRTPPTLGEPIANLFDERPRAMLQEIIARAGTSERAGAIVPMRTSGSEDGDVELVVATLPGDGAASIGVVVAAEDRTAEKERGNLTRHLDSANRDGAIALAQASLCHDLSNALTAATLCLTTLEQTNATGGAARDALLDDLGAALRHANDVVRRGKNASAIAATKEGDASIRECIEHALRVVAPLARAASVRLTSTLDGDAHVAMSATELTQVLTNMVTNSVHAIDDLGRPGEVDVSASRPSAERVTITVKDDGPGIEPALLLESFEAFQTTRAARGGTGLGLAIARRIIESAGGRIDVLTNPGRSLEMRIELPVVATGGCTKAAPPGLARRRPRAERAVRPPPASPRASPTAPRVRARGGGAPRPRRGASRTRVHRERTRLALHGRRDGHSPRHVCCSATTGAARQRDGAWQSRTISSRPSRAFVTRERDVRQRSEVARCRKIRV